MEQGNLKKQTQTNFHYDTFSWILFRKPKYFKNTFFSEHFQWADFMKNHLGKKKELSKQTKSILYRCSANFSGERSCKKMKVKKVTGWEKLVAR